VIAWFRLDLRLADNPALCAALASGANIVPVFLWSPEEEGAWPMGAASRWWLHQSLAALQRDLEAFGSKLIIRRGPALDALQTLAVETGARRIYWNRRYDPCGITCDENVKAKLRASGLHAESFAGNLLYEPWTIKNSSGNPFQVFTAYWRATQRLPEPDKPLSAPAQIPAPQQWPHSIPLGELKLESKIDWASGFGKVWTPGEADAARHMRIFDADHYAQRRDIPSIEGTSRLSPHLHFGEVSPRQVWHATVDAESYRRQLVWREFAHYLLFHFQQTPSQPLRPEYRAFPWRVDGPLLEAWTQGRTGYPLVDAGMRELWQTGWMHNRVRMVVASFLVKHLLISWQEGAAWFWDTLVDADLANNTFGWQWAAGCGADAAPYFRVFNPTLQARKFDPDNAYIRRWAPDVAAAPIVQHEVARARALQAWSEMKAAVR
jgi:deoxyribodipyrimidine photo-lyase